MYSRVALLSRLTVFKRCVYVIFVSGYELSLSLSLLCSSIMCHCYCLICCVHRLCWRTTQPLPLSPWVSAECRGSRNCQRRRQRQMQMWRSTTNRDTIETTANASWPQIPSCTPGNGLLSVATNWCVCVRVCVCSTFFTSHRWWLMWVIHTRPGLARHSIIDLYTRVLINVAHSSWSLLPLPLPLSPFPSLARSLSFSLSLRVSLLSAIIIIIATSQLILSCKRN